jgi:hypothetical protein
MPKTTTQPEKLTGWQVARYGNIGFEIIDNDLGQSVAVVNKVQDARFSHVQTQRDRSAARGEAAHQAENEAAELLGSEAKARDRAYVIAAAPEMFAALSGALPVLTELAKQLPVSRTLINQVKDALLKAKGE